MLISRLVLITIELLIADFSTGEIYKEIFKVKSGKYRSFYNIDYKFINLPPNIYQLNISFDFIRWIGFESFCPTVINITGVLQFGTFPLFGHDARFAYRSGGRQTLRMETAAAEKRIRSRIFELQSPRGGLWILAAVSDTADEFYHPYLCLADLQYTFIGYIFNPSISVTLPLSNNSLTVPILLNKSEGKLVEIKSQMPLNNLRISSLCQGCVLKISVGHNVIPIIPTPSVAKNSGLIFRDNDTIVSFNHVEMSSQFFLYIQCFSPFVVEANLFIEYAAVQSNKQIIFLPRLVKVRGETIFSYKFCLLDSEYTSIPLHIRSGKIIIIPFYIEPIKDQGSILAVDLTILKKRLSNYTFYICFADFGISNSSELISLVKNSTKCRQSTSKTLLGVEKLKYKFYYPEWNWWYISLMIQPPPGITDVHSEWDANMSVFSNGCKEKIYSCNLNGVCLLSAMDTGLVSACHCYKPYYGLDCLQVRSDNSNYANYERNWLVFSNMAFIPAMVIAAVQELFVLVFLYITTAVFSMVYHMCNKDDSDPLYCNSRIKELVYYDHLAAVISIWVTMMILSTLPYKTQMLLNIFMTFVCVVLANLIQKSIWFYGLPISIGLLILIICWIIRMRQLKCIFPPLDWWILGLIPGLLIALIGFIMFRLSIKNQYEYYRYHSLWHVLIALSICFILPNTKRWRKALKQTAPESQGLVICNFLKVRNERWHKFKKDLNYYIHFDVLLDRLLERNSSWSIFKSY